MKSPTAGEAYGGVRVSGVCGVWGGLVAVGGGEGVGALLDVKVFPGGRRRTSYRGLRGAGSKLGANRKKKIVLGRLAKRAN